MSGQPPQWPGWQAARLGVVLFHQVGEPLLLIDPLTELVLDANPPASRLAGLDWADLLQTPVRSLIRHEQGWQDWLSPGPDPVPRHRQGFLFRTHQPDGWVPVSLSLGRLLVPGQDAVLLATLRDQREQVETQRRLQRAEAEHRLVLSSVSDGLWSCRIDPDGQAHCRYLSPGIQRLTGRPISVLQDNPHVWEQAIDPEDLPAWQHFHERARSGYSGALTYRLDRPDGSRIRVQESIVVAPDEDGLILHGILTEISDRQGQREPGRVGQQLARLDSLAKLAGSLAHDFNNLITGILGHLSLYRLSRRGGEAPPSGPRREVDSEDLDEIENITLRAADLCQHLTLLAGKTRDQRPIADPTALIRTVATSLVGPTLSRVRLLLDIDEVRSVGVAEGPLRQVVTALVRNAIEALGEGKGEIVVRGRLAPRPGQEAGVRGQGSGGRSESGSLCFHYSHPDLTSTSRAFCLEVQDNGPGMPPQVQAHLFEPFFSTRAGQRGLGLATVLGVVRGCQGAVQVHSRVGQGTCVRVFLPLEREDQVRPVDDRAAIGPSLSSSGAGPSASTAQGPGMALLADDEDTVLSVASRLLVSLGWQVVTAQDGEQALAQFRQHAGEIRLALVDLTMPRLCGEKTIRELSRLAPDLPIILMSGYPETDIRPRFADLPRLGYLQKPFRLPALTELIGEILMS